MYNLLAPNVLWKQQVISLDQEGAFCDHVSIKLILKYIFAIQ